MPQGKGVRCAGFRSADGEYEHCQREEHAGSLAQNEHTTPPTYAHRLHGACGCGVTHGPAAYTPGRPRVETHRYPGVNAETGERVGEHVRVDAYDTNGHHLSKKMWWEPKGVKVASLALHNAGALQRAQVEGHPVKTIIVTEGERKCDVLNAALTKAGRRDLLAVGTMTGASATPCDVALRVLVGSTV
jgi:hypothetical protein